MIDMRVLLILSLEGIDPEGIDMLVLEEVVLSEVVDMRGEKVDNGGSKILLVVIDIRGSKILLVVIDIRGSKIDNGDWKILGEVLVIDNEDLKIVGIVRNLKRFLLNNFDYL